MCKLMGSKLEVESKEGEGSRFFFALESEVCETIDTLAKQIHNPPIYLLSKQRPICDDVIHQLENFGIPFKIVTLEELVDIGDREHTVISFDYMQHKALSTLTKNIILIDNHQEAFILAENEQSIWHTDSFEKCPSVLYNAIWEMNALKDKKIKQTTVKEQLDLTVLVAEDYDVNRIVIDEMLKKYGIEADFVFNGFEAVEKTIHKTYDIIFMDINMPKMNGIEAMKLIRKRKVQTPIIALTANALEGDREHYLSEGMNDCISKPIEKNALDSLLKHYAGKRNLPRNSDKTEYANTDKEDIVVDNEILTSLCQARKRMFFSIPIMKRLYDSFVTSSHNDVQELLDALEKSDMVLVKIKAHGIRGSASSLNFTEIIKLCQKLENKENTDMEIDYLSVSRELKKKIDEMHDTKTTILAKLTELE